MELLQVYTGYPDKLFSLCVSRGVVSVVICITHTVQGFSPERHDGCGIDGVYVHSYCFGYNCTAKDFRWTNNFT